MLGKLKYNRESALVQVVAEIAEIQSLRPYIQDDTKICAGSGIIIDAEHGLIISNAHVVGNAVNITVFSGITGKKPLKCNLESIIRERDLALLRLEDEDRDHLLELTPAEELNASPVDHLNVQQGSVLFAAGFPLGTRQLQLTTGCLSGISTTDSYIRMAQSEDSYSRDPTFITTSAGLNHGMSGGGLFDQDGGLVAIITAVLPSTSQIGFGIPSRVVIACLDTMLKNITPALPTLHFRWSNLSSDTYTLLTGKKHDEENFGGIMIRKVLPDSVFRNILKPKDVLIEIEFDLIEVTPHSLLKTFNRTHIHDKNKKSKSIIGYVEQHGDITLSSSKNKGDRETLFGRKFSIPEIVDYFVIGSEFNIKYFRGQKHHKEKCYFTPNEKIYRIPGLYPKLQNMKWLKIGGVVIQDVSLNVLAECPRYKYLDEIEYYDNFLFTPSVLITHVDPSSEIGSHSIFTSGDVVIKINGQKVKTIENVKSIIEETGGDEVIFETDRGATAVCKI